MKQIILLNYNENTYTVENEERNKFIKAVLEGIGLSIGDIWKNEELTPIDRIKLRSLLDKEDIIINERGDGTLDIYVKNKIIAKWEECQYKLKTDPNQIDQKKKLYIEMTMNFWTIFDEQGEL